MAPSPAVAVVGLLQAAILGLGLITVVLMTAPTWLVLTVLAVLTIEGTRLGWRACRRGPVLKAYNDERTAAGDIVWTGSLYAAHPTGLRHGRLLVDELLTHLPPQVRLTIIAANEQLAKNYRDHHGFTPPTAAGTAALILERAPRGVVGAGRQVAWGDTARATGHLDRAVASRHQ